MSSAGVSENPKFKLFYFDIKALAEPIRLLFAYGGQEYEDVRVTSEEWPALKSSKYLRYTINLIIVFCFKEIVYYIDRSVATEKFYIQIKLLTATMKTS